MPMIEKRLLCLFIIGFFLNGCSSTIHRPDINTTEKQSINDRNLQLQQLSTWEISAKIAFLQEKKRQSAFMNWSVQEENQKLNLSTFLGINVFHLESLNNSHTIEINDKIYQSNNLDELIYSLTGYLLPADGLKLWLKGLPFHHSDQMLYNSITKLPETLVSFYDGHIWQIKYDHYININNHLLATKLTINQGDLTIKIAINQWTL